MSRARKATFYPHTDVGNAEMFAALNASRVRYDHKRKRWLLWESHWWTEDVDGQMMRLARDAARYRLRLACGMSPGKDRNSGLAFARRTEAKARLEAMLGLAQNVMPLADKGNEWDRDPWLFGLTNGVIDLRTGKLRHGKPQDRITLHSPVVYDPKAKAPCWEKFLVDAFDRDTEMISFVQRCGGYSLTGDASEQVLIVLHGPGSNGKSTFFGGMRSAVGQYASNLPFSALELNQRSSIPNDIACLANRRFVTSSETNESARLNAARIKMLTGGDPVSARFLYKEFFDFVCVAKFWLAFNHKPIVEDDSEGFWRRIMMIPFLHTFAGIGRDKRYDQKLKAEAAGILNWLIRGCLEWQKAGLDPPKKVLDEATAWRQESDPLKDFIDEICVLDPTGQTTASEMWRVYRQWADSNREKANRRTLHRGLTSRGCHQSRTGHAGTWIWQGIRLKDPASP